MSEPDSGTFVISIDTELAWGSFDLGRTARYEKQFANTRSAIRDLLGVFEDSSISATWAIVGHLFLDRCAAVAGVKHPEIVRPDHSWYRGDWFDQDPCSDITSAPYWYGRDIVQWLRDCRVPQEIGSHTFSHVIFGDPGCSRQTAGSELRECQRLASQAGLTLASLVFPRNSEGHHAALQENGFICYRGRTKHWYDRLPWQTSRLGHFVDQAAGLCPPTVTARVDEFGLVNVPDSMFYPPHDGLWKLIPVERRVQKALRGLRAAVLNKSIFHLTFHPFNLATDSGALIDGLERVVRFAAEQRESGKLSIRTMGQVAEDVLGARTSMPLASELHARPDCAQSEVAANQEPARRS